MNNKLELVIRKMHKNLIATGVMLTSNHSAGELSGYELFGEKTGDNTFLIHLRKECFEPRNEFNESFEKHALSELPTEEIWRRFESKQANWFGGVIMGRDNQKFEFESADLNRIALVSVLEDTTRVVQTDGHYMFRSTHCVESHDFLTFFMERDECEYTKSLLSNLEGDGLMSFYRKPFWTDLEENVYRLKSDLSLKGIELHKVQYRDLIQYGSVQPSTKEVMRSHWLNVNDEKEYVDFVQALDHETNLAFEHFDRLLTESEHQAIKDAVKRITKNNYPQVNK